MDNTAVDAFKVDVLTVMRLVREKWKFLNLQAVVNSWKHFSSQLMEKILSPLLVVVNALNASIGDTKR